MSYATFETMVNIDFYAILEYLDDAAADEEILDIIEMIEQRYNRKIDEVKKELQEGKTEHKWVSDFY